MIVLTQEQAIKRLESSDNLCVIRKMQKGNHTGARTAGIDKTILEKELMAELAIENKLNGINIKDTAVELGIAPTTLSGYIHGKYTTDRSSDDSVQKPNNKADLILEKAGDRINSAIDHITEVKLEKSDASELASVAQKLASVIEKTLGKDRDTSNTMIQVQVYAPTLIQESAFGVIEI